MSIEKGCRIRVVCINVDIVGEPTPDVFEFVGKEATVIRLRPEGFDSPLDLTPPAVLVEFDDDPLPRVFFLSEIELT